MDMATFFLINISDLEDLITTGDEALSSIHTILANLQLRFSKKLDPDSTNLIGKLEKHETECFMFREKMRNLRELLTEIERYFTAKKEAG